MASDSEEEAENAPALAVKKGFGRKEIRMAEISIQAICLWKLAFICKTPCL